MGINKSLMTDYGLELTYHEIISANVDWQKSRANFVICSWVDKLKMLDGYNAVNSETIELDFDDFNYDPFNDLRGQLYEYLINDNERFFGASYE